MFITTARMTCPPAKPATEDRRFGGFRPRAALSLRAVASILENYRDIDALL
jgi:hypothetical protein